MKNLKNKIKNMKGITLIALIITIIVLLILAGVVINMTVGNEGIIGKAQSAVDIYKNAQEKEEWILNADLVSKNGEYKEDKDKIQKLTNKMIANNSIFGNCYFKNGEFDNAYKAFDESLSTSAKSSATNQTEDYIEYDLKNSVKLNAIEISFEETAHIFSHCIVTASNDENNWDTIIDTEEFTTSKSSYILDVKNEYTTKEYKYIRIWQIGTRLGGGDNRMCVAEIQMYGQ